MNKGARHTLLTAFVLMDESRRVKPGDKEAKFTRSELEKAIGAVECLQRVAQEVHRMEARECNEPMNAASKARHAARLEDLTKRAVLILAPFRVGVQVGGGDPRGESLWLLTTVTGRYNTLGGAADGWAV